MHLIGSLMIHNRYHEPMAEIDVQSDTAETWDNNDSIRRLVTGAVRQTWPMWENFMTFWSTDPSKRVVVDGRSYFPVKHLQVDHDHYSFDSFVNVEGSTLRLILLEQFYGTVEEYREELQQRNRRKQECLDRWHRASTPNDLQELTGRPPFNHPNANQPLAPEILADYRKVYLDQGSPSLSRNMII